MELRQTYRKLGSTGLMVSPVSLGASPLGGVFGDIGEQQGIDLVRHAIKRGINMIDVSPFYGLTRAETVLGKALAGGWRDRVILCTKAGRIGNREFDFSAAQITRSIDESLRRLGTDHVDILQAHDIEHATNYEQVFSETYDALVRLREAGKCRLIGMTAYPLGLLRRAICECELDVVLSYCHFTLQNRRMLDGLSPLAEENNVGLINASPLIMGLLSAKGPPVWHPASAEIKDACQAANRLCREQGSSLASLALQYVLQDERVATTLVGAATFAEVDSAIDALTDPIDEQLLADVLQTLAGVKDQSWPSGQWRK